MAYILWAIFIVVTAFLLWIIIEAILEHKELKATWTDGRGQDDF